MIFAKQRVNQNLFIMKKITIILTVLLMLLGGSVVNAQQGVMFTSDKKQKVDEKQDKTSKKDQKQKAYDFFNKLAADTSIIFTGNLWSDGSRGTVSIDPTINFLVVKGEKAFFQFGLDNVGPGVNGLGGASYEGRVVSYKFSKGKNSKRSSNILVVVKPDYYQSTITFNLTFFGDTGTLSFSGGRGQRISMDGTLNNPEKVNLMGSGSNFRRK